MSRHRGRARRNNQPPSRLRQNTPGPVPGQAMGTDAVQDGWIRAQISAELLEDAHPGSGSGAGGIDGLVARDRHGRPVVWASHLEGVLRDAAWRLSGEDAAAGFFGRAGGQRQHAVFTSLYAESDPASRIWRSAARAAFDNRAPRDDTLRAVEYVPKGTRFAGQVGLPAPDLPFLRRLLQEVDALGGGRAAGAGRVRLSLVGTRPSGRAIGSATGRLVLLLRSLDPLCITGTATPGNLIPSLAFVPGRALLGALAGWLIAEGRQNAATRLVSGRVSVSDALPLPQVPATLSAAEVLPAPLSLQSVKPGGAPGPIPWWAQPHAAARRLDGRDSHAQRPGLKRPDPDLFVYRGAPAEPWTAFRPQLRVRLRNGRPNPNQADPLLFAIEQIVEETSFLCEIRGTPEDMDAIAAGLQPVLEGSRWLRIGRGGAPVEVVQLAWTEEPSPVDLSSRAILTLTSEILVRDEHLRWRTSLDNDVLRGLPGWPADVRVSPVIQEAVAVHGFNGTSRLWRMPAYGVRRGSVFDVDGEGVAELARMMAEGQWLGERTHEGFGRFRLDETLPGVTIDNPASMPTPPPKPDQPEDAIAATTRQWLEAHPALAESGTSLDRRPSLSQWLDLVDALERDRDAPGALSARQNPTTAGGRSWRHPDARWILDKLDAVPSTDRAVYARLFVRWLRAEMRRRKA